MPSTDLALSQDAFNANLLSGVMLATAQTGEGPDDARIRRAAIVEMFRGFDPANPMQSMIACHCVALHFVLNAAMRDAAGCDLDTAMMIRMRASAMSISKVMHQWVSKFERMRLRDAARAAEAASPADRAGEAPSRPRPIAAPAPRGGATISSPVPDPTPTPSQAHPSQVHRSMAHPSLALPRGTAETAGSRPGGMTERTKATLFASASSIAMRMPASPALEMSLPGSSVPPVTMATIASLPNARLIQPTASGTRADGAVAPG